MSLRPIHLAVALDGAAAADERAAFTARHWLDQVRRAEAGLLDFVTVEDGFTGPDRLDASLIAARVAPATAHIGLVPTVTTTHTEPFHVSKVIATLDYASTGRAGWNPRIGAPTAEAPLFGRRPRAELELASALAEAADHVQVVRRLWDSWEDDAEIRDAATGRFIDREKLHYIDFAGPRFSVRGPSITPRPPQGQPPVVAGAHTPAEYAFAAGSADVVLVAPRTVDEIPGIVLELRAAQAAAGRADDRVLIFGDLPVEFGEDPTAATALADRLALWALAGLDGFRLVLGSVPRDLAAVTDLLVPELQARGLFRRSYEADTLRGLLGFERPANRYATAAA
jgi:alkanesulfonate monooxygenase SsuD/methylene tetrahydromethanopterin reductase-like flavin-dependent oxidoreductase (luciferase family)